MRMRIILIAAAIGFALVLPARALDLNDYRRAHKLPPLQYSSELAAAAQWHANDLARRNRLDHKGFRQRIRVISSTAAENVSYGCESEACAIRQWARSGGHRRNMLMKGVSRYGLASARSQRGRMYWVLVVGN
jgi:uncharacterized protein YkwD